MTLKVNSEEEKDVGDYLVYTVKSGDSLWKIASKFNTTVETLRKVNNLTTDLLILNQQLLIPKGEDIDINIDKNDEGIIYTVKAGDSLYKIANIYGVSVDAIKSANNLTNDFLSIGQELLIPVVDTEVNENTESDKGGISYVVVSGDNLYSIANKYGVTVDDIKKYNNLTSNVLQIGQVILIPGTEQFVTYKVKSGDTLYSIANKYGVSVNELKNINNLDGSFLSIGQELLIPTK